MPAAATSTPETLDRAKLKTQGAPPKKDLVTSAKHLMFTERNADDHFLLMDLDVEKDAALFGADRELFYANVAQMKRVVVEYQRWERRDEFYTYATRALQAVSVALVYDCWEQRRHKAVLAASLGNFAECHEEDLATLAAKRAADVAKAVEDLRESPPDFRHVVAADADRRRLEAERKQRLADAVVGGGGAAAAAADAKPVDHPLDTKRQDEGKRKDVEERNVTALALAAAPTSVASVKALRRILLPQSDDWTSVVKARIAAYQKEKFRELDFPRDEARA
jgi:hypothetical protein